MNDRVARETMKYLPVKERAALGRAARTTVPRASLAEHTPPIERDPVAVITEQAAKRQQGPAADPVTAGWPRRPSPFCAAPQRSWLWISRPHRSADCACRPSGTRISPTSASSRALSVG